MTSGCDLDGVHPGALLTDFGWTPEDKRLRGDTPNAVAALAVVDAAAVGLIDPAGPIP